MTMASENWALRRMLTISLDLVARYEVVVGSRRTTRQPHELGASIAASATSETDLAYSRALTAYGASIDHVYAALADLFAGAPPEHLDNLKRALSGMLDDRRALDTAQIRRVIGIVTGGQIMTDVLRDVLADLRTLQSHVNALDSGAQLRDKKLDAILELLQGREATA